MFQSITKLIMALPPLSSSSEAALSSGVLSPEHQAWVSWIDQLVKQRIPHRLSESSSSSAGIPSVATLPIAYSTGQARQPLQQCLTRPAQVQSVSRALMDSICLFSVTQSYMGCSDLHCLN